MRRDDRNQVTVELSAALVTEFERAYSAYEAALNVICDSSPPSSTDWQALNAARHDLAEVYERCCGDLGSLTLGLGLALRLAADHLQERADSDERLGNVEVV